MKRGLRQVTMLFLVVIAGFVFPQSLWQSAQTPVYSAPIAAKAGDIILIRIDEYQSASQKADTKLNRRSQMDGEALLNWNQAASFLSNGGANAEDKGKASISARNNFAGGGSTGRSSQLRASLTAAVYKVDGDRLFIQGSKKIIINNEEEEMTIEGVIRRQDIQEDNTVRSSLISEAVLKLKGYGSVSNDQEKGVLGRMFDWVF